METLQNLCIEKLIEHDPSQLDSVNDDIFRDCIIKKFDLDICSIFIKDKYKFQQRKMSKLNKVLH